MVDKNALNRPPTNARGSSRLNAQRFLIALLTKGPMRALIVKVEANAAGFAWATIRRTKSDLGIKSVKISMGSGWVWALPTEGAQYESKMLTQFGDHGTGAKLKQQRCECCGVLECVDDPITEFEATTKVLLHRRCWRGWYENQHSERSKNGD